VQEPEKPHIYAIIDFSCPTTSSHILYPGKAFHFFCLVLRLLGLEVLSCIHALTQISNKHSVVLKLVNTIPMQ
jgi:hypothetical protein